jgi:hypothetical protein
MKIMVWWYRAACAGKSGPAKMIAENPRGGRAPEAPATIALSYALRALLREG